VGVAVRWEKASSKLAGNYTFFYGNWNDDDEIWAGLFVHKGIISAAKRPGSVRDRTVYIILRRCWCDINVLNVHAQAQDKTEELECVFDQLCIT
jgi:hypothetical protein